MTETTPTRGAPVRYEAGDRCIKPEKDAGLTRDPVAMADACLATWSTPHELQVRHKRGNHEHCPRTWCEVAAIRAQADEQCKRPRENSVIPSERTEP